MTVRLCPVCLSDERHALHTLTLTYGGEQTVFSCDDCGMTYSSGAHSVNYDTGSIYALPNASGSGESALDAVRQESQANFLGSIIVSRYSPVLDVGCARGGLLHQLRKIGFRNLSGMDPSSACVKTTLDRGIYAYQGTLSDEPRDQYYVIILSHVLEHIEDVCQALSGIKNRLDPRGRVYIEVPDAERYCCYDVPFMDFNSEHINHFTAHHLMMALCNHGFDPYLGIHRKSHSLSQGVEYPSIWTVASVRQEAPSPIGSYIIKSKEELLAINAYLEGQLEGLTEVAIWGCNSYCANLTSLPVFSRVKIVQAVDRNPALHGRMTSCGISVEPVENIRQDIPIVITSLMAIQSILDEIGARDLPNRVISIHKMVYA